MIPTIVCFVAVFATMVLILSIIDPFGDGSRPGLFVQLLLSITLWMLVFATFRLNVLDKTIERCEANLQRTQHCVLVAVPAKGS